eukprot:1149454-Pelagomonas_calceolata.AAC.6
MEWCMPAELCVGDRYSYQMMCSMSGMLFQTEGVYTVHAFQAGLATQPGWSALFCEKMLSHYFLVLRTKEEALLSLFKTFSRWLLAFTIKKLWKGKDFIAAPAYMGSLGTAKKVPATQPVRS